MASNKRVVQPSLIYNNPTLLKVSEFLEPNELVNLTQVIREVDEKVETIPRNMTMYSDCTDLERLVNIPDLELLHLDASERKDGCRMDLLYQLTNLVKLFVFYPGGILLDNFVNMRKLRKLDLRDCILDGNFLPMNLRTVTLDGVELEQFSLESLSNLELLETLALDDIKLFDRKEEDPINLSFISRISNLEYLILNNLGKVKSFKFLTHLPDLSQLTITKTTTEDYSPLGKSTNLTNLKIRSSGADRVDWVYNLVNLVSLDLEGFYVSDNSMERISELPKLEFLRLDNAAITTTRYFPLMSNLDILHLIDCNEILEYKYLAECEKLKEIALVVNSFAEDPLVYLAGLKHLIRIDLQTDFTQVYNYSLFKDNKVLGALVLDEAKLDNNDLETISTISNLELLKISNFYHDEDVEHFDDNGVEHLSKLTNLTVLYIQGSPLVTSEGISKLNRIPDLTDLYLSDCSGIDNTIFNILATFPSLEEVELDRFEEKDTLPLRMAKPDIVIKMVDRQPEPEEEPQPQEEQLPYQESEVGSNIAEVPPSDGYDHYVSEEDFNFPRWTFNLSDSDGEYDEDELFDPFDQNYKSYY